MAAHLRGQPIANRRPQRDSHGHQARHPPRSVERFGERPIQFVKGVGPARAEHFRKLGIETVHDLILHFPFRHQVQGAPQAIDTLAPGESATIVGRVVAVELGGRPWKPIVRAEIEDDSGYCELCWFNAAYMAERLQPSQRVRVHGRVRNHHGIGQFTNPRVEPADESSQESNQTRLEPVYRAVEKLASRQIAKVVAYCLPKALPEIEELFDEAYLAKRRLARRRTAIERMHLPVTPQDVPIARERLAYDELFLMQLAIALKRRRSLQVDKSIALPTTNEIDQHIRRRFPFALTKAQDRAIREIVADLAKAHPMNRLLQGDVGCGKTVVALYAALVAIAQKQQAAILAPTEVLAEQHFANIEQYLAGSRVRRVLLTGRTTAAKRREAIKSIAAGEIDLVVGTQALLEHDVLFKSLSLAVVDEQHKFGVAQRGTLRSRGTNQLPHYLVMSATPIPRTLSMTVFGDLDVSIIDERPPGRQPVTTQLFDEAHADRAWAVVRQRLAAGEQAFVVYPLVEESESMPLRAATREAKHIAKDILPGATIELLHGKMSGADKQAAMERFSRGEARVLVCTTVIEVGIDVPNATVMVIQHADRYGLATLHQLRGRIGRGTKPGYCLLLSERSTQAAMRRLSILCETTDGFRIAEEDLRMRGPGEVLGTAQHGWPELKVANLADDVELLERAREDALALAREDPALRDAKHAAIRRELVARFRSRMAWIDVA